MPLLLHEFVGKKIDFLGSNQNVDLTTAATYTIFTPGVVAVRSQSGRTWVQFVTITPNGNVTAWDAGASDFNIANGTWAITRPLSPTQYNVPAVVGANRGATARTGTMPNQTPFTITIVNGNANNGIATVAAYGWEL